MFEQLYSRDEVKAFLGIGETKLCQLVNNGVMPMPVRFGRKTYWFKDSMERVVSYLQRHAESTMRRR